MKKRLLSLILAVALCMGLTVPAFAAQDTETETGFSDVKSGAYYADAVAWAVEQGITTGTSDTTFSPSDTCTRGQIVTFLYRAFA